ncbi:MAG: bifunctional phosphopantothenoylcysteine decarboxylase/phosphopantothenate--cysteine ligase CoaBC [Bacteroidales bacterium]
MLKGKNILVGITGSIAAYKTAQIVRLLAKKGATVQVIMTPAGKEFITPVTLSTLTGRPVYSDFFAEKDGYWHSHVSMGLWADAMLIAPATASTMGKMAHGIADNLLVTTYMSCKSTVFVAPAMDLDMYAHPSTANNLALLRSFGNHIIEPASGELASGLIGKGRMEEPEVIVDYIERFFVEKDILNGKKVVITAGPTQEAIDPVRFIGNHSSGKMGFALAETCAALGAEVTLIAGPVDMKLDNSAIKRVDVVSASQMYEATTEVSPDADVVILCAAVADFTPDTLSESKIKREGEDLVVRLKPTKDIAASVGAAKKPGQLVVGFALETDNELNNAQDKLKRKNLDFIVLNSLKEKGAGFGTSTNKITILDSNGERVEYPLKSKDLVARDIVDKIVSLLAL